MSAHDSLRWFALLYGILLCTHLLEDVERLCTRIGVIHRGETLVEGGLAELEVPRGGLQNYYLTLVGTERRMRHESDLVPHPQGMRGTSFQ